MYISKKVLVVLALVGCLFAFSSNNRGGFDLGVLAKEYPFLSQIDDEVEAAVLRMKQNYQKNLQMGIEAYDKAYYQSAIDHLLDANRTFPTASGSLMLGGAFLKMKKLKDAEVYLRGAIAIARENGHDKIEKSAKEILGDMRSVNKDAI